MSIDSDITPPPEHRGPTEPEQTRCYEIRAKQTDERPRYWTGTDFSTKPEEAVQFDSWADAELQLSRCRAGSYIITIGL